MKESIFPVFCAVYIALSGCSISRPEQVATRVITVGIIQVADFKYRLQASEMWRTSTQESWASSAVNDELNYPDVLAAVGAGEKTVEIRNSNGNIAAAASLSIYLEGGDMFASYRLKRETVDAGIQTQEGTVKLHGGRDEASGGAQIKNIE